MTTIATRSKSTLSGCTIKNAFFIAIICMFTIHSNLIAETPNCNIDNNIDATYNDTREYYTCPATASALSCHTSCTSASCTIVGLSLVSGTLGFCSCDSCESGYYRDSATTNSWDVTYTQFCGSQPTFYTCTQCPSGNYSNGGTVTQCTPCQANTYGGGGDSSSCKKCPANANCCDGQSGCSGFTCNEGYEQDGDHCVAKCPDNSTRNNAGNCICDTGYYGNSAKCKSCPENATCAGGTDFKCNADFYKNNSQCEKCPTRDDVFTDLEKNKAQYKSNADATSITDCYLPSGTYYNDKGKFTLSNMCPYKQQN